MRGCRRRASAVSLALYCLLPAAACSPATIVLETQGSFAFGGTVITGADGNTFRGDHGYAQYQIPSNARTLPLVMWHGGGQFSKTWETTPDGRDGFQNLFLQRGGGVRGRRERAAPCPAVRRSCCTCRTRA